MNFKLYIIILSLVLINSACKDIISQDERPNIVWITSEDNSKHYLKLFDKNGVETPNIASLAKQGLLFTRAFSNSPVCSAARSTLISGCYGPRLASHYHRKIEKVAMPEGLKMFPAYLRQAGYYTTNNYKEDYNIIKTSDVWDESSKTATWKNRKEGQPFFHVQNIHTTHESRLHFTLEDMESSKTNTNLNSITVQPNHPQTRLFKYTNAYYRDKIVEMDQQVGEVVENLKQDGLLKNTFIFYFADHGGVLPGSKGYLYETGLHIPLVVYVPEKFKHLNDADPGEVVNGFVSFVDFAPTVLNLAGVDIPSSLDGKPFLGKNVDMEEVIKRDISYSYADRFDEKYDMVRAVRRGKYKYIRSYQPFNFDGMRNNYRYKQLAYQEWLRMYQKGKLNNIQSAFFEPRAPELLFDIESDPYETKNLASGPQYREILQMMRTLLTNWVEDMPDLSFYPESYLVENAFDNIEKFSRKHRPEILKLRNIADLSCNDFSKTGPILKTILNSDHEFERYWGLIVCSSYGEDARGFIPDAKMISQKDPSLLVRVRAAEFLAIVGAENPNQVMSEALYQTRDGVEALLILNSIIRARDGQPGYDFNLHVDRIDPKVKEMNEVKRRLHYLNLL